MFRLCCLGWHMTSFVSVDQLCRFVSVFMPKPQTTGDQLRLRLHAETTNPTNSSPQVTSFVSVRVPGFLRRDRTTNRPPTIHADIKTTFIPPAR